jgi:hypothetical protein
MQCPQHKKALEKLAIEDIIKKCEMCGRVANLYCSSCKFVLCNQCRICDKRHFLIKMIDLEVHQLSLRKSKPNTTQTIMCVVHVRKTKSAMTMGYGTVINATMMCVHNV